MTLKTRILSAARRTVVTGLLLFVVVAPVLPVTLSGPYRVWAQLAPDQPAPPFALDDLEGRRHALADARGTQLVILYFCDLESSSNRNGLSRINALLEAHPNVDVKAFAVTASPAEKAKALQTEIAVSFPLLVDTTGVINDYHSHLILPTVYLLDRELMVSKVVLGGGRSMEIQLEQALKAAAPSSRDFPPRSSAASQGSPPSSPIDEGRRSDVARAPSLPPPPIRKTTESADEKARRLFHLAREENLKLQWDDCLASKARERARSLHDTGDFGHKDPESGRNPAFDMVRSCHRDAATAGENLTRGMEMTARAIHRELMASSTHRGNIRNRRFSKMGVGCHETICVELFVGF